MLLYILHISFHPLNHKWPCNAVLNPAVYLQSQLTIPSYNGSSRLTCTTPHCDYIPLQNTLHFLPVTIFHSTKYYNYPYNNTTTNHTQHNFMHIPFTLFTKKYTTWSHLHRYFYNHIPLQLLTTHKTQSSTHLPHHFTNCHFTNHSTQCPPKLHHAHPHSLPLHLYSPFSTSYPHPTYTLIHPSLHPRPMPQGLSHQPRPCLVHLWPAPQSYQV